MKKVIVFHFCFLATISYALYLLHASALSEAIFQYKLLGTCVLLGGFGGSIYCLRGVYLNACVKGIWTAQWEPWYYIRPAVSLVCGGISYLFLNASLIVLEAVSKPGNSEFGFMALAFIAGLNVDKFIGKIEEVGQASWGIEKSRVGSRE